VANLCFFFFKAVVYVNHYIFLTWYISLVYTATDLDRRGGAAKITGRGSRKFEIFPTVVLKRGEHLPGRGVLVDFGPRRPAPAERRRIPWLRDLPERPGAPGTGRPGPAAAVALRRHDAWYAAHTARARRTAGRGRGRGRLVRVRRPGLFGQREPLRAQVQVGHAAGDYLMEGREEAHLVRSRANHSILKIRYLCQTVISL